MVRARTGRVVMSQRDVRQTTQPEPSHSPPATPVPQTFRSTLMCTWCQANGGHYACLAESAHASCVESDYIVPPQDWFSSAMNSEGWVPASGPCCEDCLEAAFEPRRKSEVGKLGRDLIDEVHSWCSVKGDLLRQSARKGWKALRGWFEQTRLRWRPQNGDVKSSEGWSDVTYEAEGFLEVKLVVSRDGVIQYMEVDFPTDVPVVDLKAELSTLIGVVAGSQQWHYRGQQMEDSKTLEQLNVDIGAILEVKCHN